MKIVVVSKKTALAILLAVLIIWPFLARVGMDTGVSVLAVLSPANRRLPVYSVATQEKKVAISFDAAWGAERTPILLDLLEKHGVKTTFFLVTFWVEDYPEQTQEIANRGHELGLHSTTHPHMNSLSREAIREELLDNYQVINDLTGQTPTLFRPPFGEYSNKVIEVAEEEGFMTIQWSLDSLDWKDLSADGIVQRILNNVEPGDIMLFHNNGKNTPAAIDVILGRLIDDGYKVVPISELVYDENYFIDHEGKQHKRSQ